MMTDACSLFPVSLLLFQSYVQYSCSALNNKWCSVNVAWWVNEIKCYLKQNMHLNRYPRTTWGTSIYTAGHNDFEIVLTRAEIIKKIKRSKSWSVHWCLALLNCRQYKNLLMPRIQTIEIQNHGVRSGVTTRSLVGNKTEIWVKVPAHFRKEFW